MIFNKHGSFYLRKNWPMKGLKAIKDQPTIFSPQNKIEAVDELGLGNVMVTSLRYWMSAIGLAYEDRDNAGRIALYPTDLGETIYKEDPYLQRIGTDWLLHRNLARNISAATTWYWFFNKFEKKEFTKEEFIEELDSFIKIKGKSIAQSSLDRDYSCLIASYRQIEIKDISQYIEEGIISYFSELELISKQRDKKYRKLTPKENNIPFEIILYAILDDIQEDIKEKEWQISISEILEKDKSPGKLFNLSQNLLLAKLDQMEKKGHIRVYNRFGHNHIEIINKDKDKILEEYYRRDA